MVNRLGKNGTGTKIYPPDALLREALLKYSRQGLTQSAKLSRLVVDLNLDIKTTKLNELECRLNIPSVRRPGMSKEILIQAVVDEAEKDILQNNGPNYIKSKLENNDIRVARDTVRKIMWQEFPNGAGKRFPGQKKVARVNRQALSALGPFHEVSGDGHEKLGALALNMGGLSLPIYGYREKWGGQLLTCDVVPDARSPAIVGHLYIDLVDKLGGAPLQLNLDKGAEIGWQVAMQIVLRELFAPGIDPDVYRAVAILKSMHNIIIESLWRWLREKSGLNLRDVILHGKTECLILTDIEYQHNLFYWIFIPLVQAELDEFRTYWNQCTVRNQHDKFMPSGHVPDDAAAHPELFGGINCLVNIPEDVVDDLRKHLEEEIGVSREECRRFFPIEFDNLASHVHAFISSPSLSLQNAWVVFTKMSSVMESESHL